MKRLWPASPRYVDRKTHSQHVHRAQTTWPPWMPSFTGCTGASLRVSGNAVHGRHTRVDPAQNCLQNWSLTNSVAAQGGVDSIRWVDKEDNHTARARLTARVYEQELTGQENFYSATPQPATLRLLLIVAQTLRLTVALFHCAQAFLQAHLREERCVDHTTAGI